MLRCFLLVNEDGHISFLSQVSWGFEGPHRLWWGETAHPPGSVRVLEEPPTGGIIQTSYFIVLLHVIRGICGSSCRECTLSDDLSVGGQVYSDPDRGLCGRGQLGVLSWNGSWFHQVYLRAHLDTLTCAGEVTAAGIDLPSLGLCRFYVWEILHSTIRKMNKHVQKIQKELDEAKEKLEKQQNKKVEEKHIFWLPSHVCTWASQFWSLGLTVLTVTFLRVCCIICLDRAVNIRNVYIGCCINTVGVSLRPTYFLFQQ